MASIGGKRDLVTGGLDQVAGLIAADLKAAQRPAGLVIPPSSYNQSMYGATGPWTVDEAGPVTVKLPAFKFSIKSTRGITVTVKDPDIKIFSTAGVLHSHAVSYRGSSGYYSTAQKILGNRGDRVPALSAEWERLKDGIERIANAYNYDKSDLQSDYFNHGFYLYVNLDAKLADGNQALAERTISALEVAFPETWESILAEAAYEQAIETSYAQNHPGEKVQTTRRDILEMTARRALEAVAAGTFKVPFNPGRRHWGLRHSRSGKGEYYHREKKLKVGLLAGTIAANPGVAVLKVQAASGYVPAHAVGAEEVEWYVKKFTGGRGGTYRNEELVARDVADSLEAAVDAADAAMGYAPGEI